ncbi:MAG: hypothetical protein WD342_11240 [Verrucomicrobiales bacterium]
MSEMDHQEKNDPVWELLDHAPRVEPSPFFARNVVRAVRLNSFRQRSLRERIRSLLTSRLTVLGSMAAAVVAVSAVMLADRPEAPTAPEPALPIGESVAFDPASELEAVEYLGELMAVADPGQLSDEALADLFF